MPIKNANVNEAYLLSSISFSHLNRRSRRLMIINQILKIKLSHGSSKRGGDLKLKLDYQILAYGLRGEQSLKEAELRPLLRSFVGLFSYTNFPTNARENTHLVILCGDSNY